ncbi:MAG TPA: GDP-mannose 4,6-dehydratase [Phycisphaerales bacterium]|nr:GDP-mannose 4,6-dehydratase [Phycisphaerales bacterium]
MSVQSAPARDLGAVAVTGASGFIGSHLISKLLAEGHSVTAAARPNSRTDSGNLAHVGPHRNLRVIRADILDPSDARAITEECDTLFHLAAQVDVAHSLKSPSLFLQTNVTGTYNMLEAARVQGVQRIVVTSSAEVYGGSPEPLTETSPLMAKSPYAASKIGKEKLAESYYHSYRLGTVVVRLFNTFGPRQSNRAVIPWIINQAITGEELHLGNTNARRDFMFVEDTVDGLIAAATRTGVEGRVFNLATGRTHAIQEVVDRVIELRGRPLRVITEADRVRGTEEVWTLIGDSSAAARDLGWRAQVPFAEGLRRVYEYFKKTREARA